MWFLKKSLFQSAGPSTQACPPKLLEPGILYLSIVKQTLCMYLGRPHNVPGKNKKKQEYYEVVLIAGAL